MMSPLGWALGMSEGADVANKVGRQRREALRPRLELRRMHSQVRRLSKRGTEALSWRVFFHPFGVVSLSPDWPREREKRASRGVSHGIAQEVRSGKLVGSQESTVEAGRAVRTNSHGKAPAPVPVATGWPGLCAWP